MHGEPLDVVQLPSLTMSLVHQILRLPDTSADAPVVEEAKNVPAVTHDKAASLKHDESFWHNLFYHERH
jgi:hypothetical protein